MLGVRDWGLGTIGGRSHSVSVSASLSGIFRITNTMRMNGWRFVGTEDWGRGTMIEGLSLHSIIWFPPLNKID